MGKHRTKYDPEALLDKYRVIRNGVSENEFFRSPKHQKTMEMWCAAHFARAYARYVHSCFVLIDDKDIQTDVDFDLEINGVTHPFQVTEVTEPDRRRGDEYKSGKRSVIYTPNIELGTELGSTWVRDALEKKLAKHYADSSELNMLAYLNFAGRNQQYVELRDKCTDVAKHFASVWLLNGNTFCCIRSNERIQSWEGWMLIDESLAETDA